MRGVGGALALLVSAVMVGCTTADRQEGGHAKPPSKRVMEMDRIHEMTDEAKAAENNMPDKRCQEVGQFLTIPRESCAFLVCDYSRESWRDSYDNMQLFTVKMPCAPGTYVKDQPTDREPCIGRHSKMCFPKLKPGSLQEALMQRDVAYEHLRHMLDAEIKGVRDMEFKEVLHMVRKLGSLLQTQMYMVLDLTPNSPSEMRKVVMSMKDDVERLSNKADHVGYRQDAMTESDIKKVCVRMMEMMQQLLKLKAKLKAESQAGRMHTPSHSLGYDRKQLLDGAPRGPGNQGQLPPQQMQQIPQKQMQEKQMQQHQMQQHQMQQEQMQQQMQQKQMQQKQMQQQKMQQKQMQQKQMQQKQMQQQKMQQQMQQQKPQRYKPRMIVVPTAATPPRYYEVDMGQEEVGVEPGSQWYDVVQEDEEDGQESTKETQRQTKRVMKMMREMIGMMQLGYNVVETMTEMRRRLSSREAVMTEYDQLLAPMMNQMLAMTITKPKPNPKLKKRLLKTRAVSLVKAKRMSRSAGLDKTMRSSRHKKRSTIGKREWKQMLLPWKGPERPAVRPAMQVPENRVPGGSGIQAPSSNGYGHWNPMKSMVQGYALGT